MAIQARNIIPPFDAQSLEAISRILGETSSGLTGPEIGRILADCKIPDTDPLNTKWKRLYNAFVEFQNKNKVGNHVVVFVTRAMSPAAHTRTPEVFDQWRADLNGVFALVGMEIGNDGKMRKSSRATTLDEALERAGRLRSKLERRGVHPDVLEYCKSEIVTNNYFHAVFEAMKSISSKIRRLSRLDGDGHELYDSAFGLKAGVRPILAINTLATETMRGEQRGFLNLLKGLYGTVRNPISHEARIEWDMTEEDALDIMTAVSLVHRKLDKARVAPAKDSPT